MIPGKKIVTKELHTALEESKTLGAGVKFTPASGETFAEFTFEKCTKGELNKTYVVKGSDFGIAFNEESSLEFTNASSSLTVGGVEAKLRGRSKREDVEGEALLVLP